MIKRLKDLYFSQPLIINTMVTNGLAIAAQFGYDITLNPGVWMIINGINVAITWFLVTPEYVDE